MRYMVRANFPNEPFNTYVREGTVGKLISRVLEETKPETIYFSEEHGQRGAIAVYNIENASQVPSLTEPWFLTFNAECHCQLAMSVDDLKHAKLDEIGKRWRDLK